MAAIEQKQVAQQVAERQRFLVDKAKQEKLAEVILAEGETESARLIQEAMKEGNEFLQLRRIEAAKEIAYVMSHSGNVCSLCVFNCSLMLTGFCCRLSTCPIKQTCCST